MISKHVVEKWKRNRRRMVHALKRGRKEEMKVVRLMGKAVCYQSMVKFVLWCCQGPCLGLWSSCNWGFGWSLWPMLSLGPTRRPGIVAVACSLVGVWGLCHNRGQQIWEGLCCHTGSCVFRDQSVVKGHVWVHGSIVARVWMDACGFCLPLKVMRIPRVRLAILVLACVQEPWCMQIWVCCTAT